jgi:uncharacterized protein YdaL
MTLQYFLHRARALVAIALAATLVTACGGGGGGGGGSGSTASSAAPSTSIGTDSSTSSAGTSAAGNGSSSSGTGTSGSGSAVSGSGTTASSTPTATGTGSATPPANTTNTTTTTTTTAGGATTSAPPAPLGPGEFVAPGAGVNSANASATAGGAATVAVQGGGSTAPAASDGSLTTVTANAGTTASSSAPVAETSGANGTGPHALILYDAPAGSEYEKLGKSYAIMLRNLLGHFDARVDLVPVQLYTAGQLAGYDAAFYLGAIYNNPLPEALLTDVAATAKPMVWFKYNLWALTGDPTFGFAARHGFTFSTLRGLNALPSASNPTPGFFDTVSYKGLSFVKYYAWDAARNVISADPDLGVTTILDATKAVALVNVTNPVTHEQAPYVVRSGNFWYVADMPFSYIGPRDRYLVIADLLHDVLGIQHAESHKAMVRLEDVDAKVSASTMKTLTDYLSAKHIPFSIAAIPHYKDPLGIDNNGVPQDIPLAQASVLRQSLDYALQHGGEIVMHGYTHQYAAMKNPWTAVSADDYEFWDIVHNAPVPEDSTAWALGRLNAGLTELTAAGYQPVAWETPHYVASPLTSKAIPQVFDTTYQRVVYFTGDQPDFTSRPGKDFSAGQIFPYVIQRDYYGQRVLPENLGNIEYDIHQIDPTSFLTYTWQDIALNAKYALAVRDGFGSFFFHPFWLEPDLGTPGYSDFTQLIDAITALGYTWTVPSQLR